MNTMKSYRLVRVGLDGFVKESQQFLVFEFYWFCFQLDMFNYFKNNELIRDIDDIVICVG